METFRQMINDCIKIGLDRNVSSMKKLCGLAYQQLTKYDIMSCYKLCAISHAAGILANRKKSTQRGKTPRNPYARRPFLTSCYAFKIVDNVLRVPMYSKHLGPNGTTYFDIPLDRHTKAILCDSKITVRSFTLSADNTVGICCSTEVDSIQVQSLVGIDRNLRNLTVGNCKQIIQYDLSKAVDIAEGSRSVVKSLKRNDIRIRGNLYRKYGKRRKNRISQLMHKVSKAVVQSAKESKDAIAFEDIRRISQLYKRGNYQGRSYRARLNSWSFAEIKRQIEYKAAWEGVPVIQLSVKETRGTSQLCPRCGKKITQVDNKTRELKCDQCNKWMDRDVVAAMNISSKGLARFASSKGPAGEAMRGNPTTPVILRVDASKLTFRRKPKGR